VSCVAAVSWAFVHPHRSKGILLEQDCVYDFALPKGGVKVHGHAIIAQNIDLLFGFSASDQFIFQFIDHVGPLRQILYRPVSFEIPDILRYLE
jgi:hypothetical protein